MVLKQCLRRSALVASRRLHTSVRPTTSLTKRWPAAPQHTKPALSGVPAARWYATERSQADILVEEITDQYNNASDEFNIAYEETEKKTVYAAEDRAAAAEECQKLKDIYEKAIANSSPEVAAEVKKRAGQRVRELDEAVKNLELSAQQG